jgi:membrane protein DedA with SNARE-associated domain
MVASILEILGSFIVGTIDSLGYAGIVVLMAIESANIPLPSEIIMPFAGFLADQGRFTIFGVALAGALGCTLGSALSYWVGMKGGRPLIERYGKYVLISHHDLDLADRWFARWGNATAFFSRLLPVVRTFISFPLGIARSHFKRFLLYTFVGSFIWSWFLAWLGIKVGENREILSQWFHRFDAIIGLVILAGIVYWIARHIRSAKSV